MGSGRVVFKPGDAVWVAKDAVCYLGEQHESACPFSGWATVERGRDTEGGYYLYDINGATGYAHESFLSTGEPVRQSVAQMLLQADQDMVNHPPHYNGHPAGIEAIEVIEHATTLNLGNAMKYLWRVLWGSKGRDIEDLEKSVWYIQREIRKRELDNE